jgi:aminotransferase
MESLGRDYYDAMKAEYHARREVLMTALIGAGFRCTPPAGAYYILADFSGLSDLDDTAFSAWLTTEIGVTPVPGSSFFSKPEDGRTLVRFAFCKTEQLLRQAATRLSALSHKP